MRDMDGSLSSDRSQQMSDAATMTDVIRINSQSGKGGVGLYSGAASRTEAAEEDARGDGLRDKERFRRAA